MGRKNARLTLDRIPLPHYCQQTGTPYQTAYSAMLRGDLPAENVYGRWWVSESALRERACERASATSDNHPPAA